MSRLVIDATTAQHARGGIGIVASGLLGGLADLGVSDVSVLAGPDLEVREPLTSVRPPGMRRTALRMAFQRLALPVVALRERPERLLTLDSYVPAWRPPGPETRMECFVHDVLPLTHPQFFRARKDVAKRLAFRSIRRFRPRVFTSTPFTAEEIHRELGIVPEVARFGCGQFADAEADELLTSKPSARGDYVLYIGAIEARKDLWTLVRGFDLWRERFSPATRLAIAGNWQTAEGRAFRRRLRALGLSGVRFLGRVSAPVARDLLSHALALAYPSTAEGFGLPVLEGFAIGTPVVTSDIPAIRSWAGEAAFYFEPGDPRSLADCLRRATAAPLEGTAARGKALAEGYRWRGFAAQIAA